MSNEVAGQVSPLKPIALRVPDAASYCGLSRSRLYKLMQEGQLSSFTIGGRRLFQRDTLDAFIEHSAKGQQG